MNDLFKAFGLSDKEIAIFRLLLESSPLSLSLRKIERKTGYRQPEVSLSVNNLVDRGLAFKRSDNSHNRGRPELRVYLYPYSIKMLVDKGDLVIKRLMMDQSELLEMQG